MMLFRPESDEQLVARVLSGCHDGFLELVERYLPIVRSIAYARLSCRCDVDDVAQEAFLEAYQHLDRLRERRKFGPWVAAITRNVSSRLLRQRVREQEYGSSIRDTGVSHPPDMASEEVLRALRIQLDGLDGDLREVLMLHYFAGKSSREIAETLEISDVAVRKRLQRAREAVGDRLLRRFDLEDLRGAYTTKETARRIVAAALTAGATWESTAAGLSLGTLFSTGLLSTGSVSKATIALLAVLTAGSGWLYWTSPSAIPGTAPNVAQVFAARGEAQPDKLPVDPIIDEAAPTKIPVSGRVLGSDGVPISEATVVGHYRALNDLVVQMTTTSDNMGGYHFELDAPWGSLRLEVIKEGFVAANATHAKVTRDGLSGVDCTLLKESVIEGSIVDSRGNRIANFPVTAFNHTPDLTTTTSTTNSDERGAFRLAGLWPGEHGLALIDGGDYHESLEVQCVALAEGETKSDVRLVYDGPGLAVGGRVVDRSGAPVEGAFITCVENDRVTQSDSAGRFYMPQLPEGSVSLDVQHKAYLGLSASTEAGTEDLELVMRAPGLVTGIVVDTDTERPLQSFEISAIRGTFGDLDAINPPALTPYSDPEGRFEIEGTNDQYSTLIARAEGYAYGLHRLPRSPEERLEPVVVKLSKGSAVLRGRAVDATGSAVADAAIILGVLYPGTDSRMAHRQWAASDADGYFRIAGLPLRKQRVSAVHFEAGRGETYVDLPQASDAPPPEIVLKRGGSIQGTVRKDGAPLTAMRIEVRPAGSNKPWSYAQLDSNFVSDGIFQLDRIPAGPVTLHVRDGGVGGRVHREASVVREGETTHVNLEFATGSAALEGAVHWPLEERFGGFVELSIFIGDTEERFKTEFTNGTFQIVDLPAGPAKIKVLARAGSRKSGFDPRHVVRFITTTLKPGETSRVTMDLSGSATVEGLVTGLAQYGTALVSAYEGVVEIPEYAEGVLNAIEDAQRCLVVAEPNGAYQISGLPSGTYTILACTDTGTGMAWPDYARFATTVVTVEDSRVVAADFDLR